MAHNNCKIELNIFEHFKILVTTWHALFHLIRTPRIGVVGEPCPSYGVWGAL